LNNKQQVTINKWQCHPSFHYSIIPWPRPSWMAGVQRPLLRKYCSDSSLF